jgi:hypothetical protein
VPACVGCVGVGCGGLSGAMVAGGSSVLLRGCRRWKPPRGLPRSPSPLPPARCTPRSVLRLNCNMRAALRLGPLAAGGPPAVHGSWMFVTEQRAPARVCPLGIQRHWFGPSNEPTVAPLMPPACQPCPPSSAACRRAASSSHRCLLARRANWPGGSVSPAARAASRRTILARAARACLREERSVGPPG